MLSAQTLRAPFLVVGYGDRTCRVYSLAPTALLEEISMITLDAISSDLSRSHAYGAVQFFFQCF